MVYRSRCCVSRRNAHLHGAFVTYTTANRSSICSTLTTTICSTICSTITTTICSTVSSTICSTVTTTITTTFTTTISSTFTTTLRSAFRPAFTVAYDPANKPPVTAPNSLSVCRNYGESDAVHNGLTTKESNATADVCVHYSKSVYTSPANQQRRRVDELGDDAGANVVESVNHVCVAGQPYRESTANARTK